MKDQLGVGVIGLHEGRTLLVGQSTRFFESFQRQHASPATIAHLNRFADFSGDLLEKRFQLNSW